MNSCLYSRVQIASFDVVSSRAVDLSTRKLCHTYTRKRIGKLRKEKKKQVRKLVVNSRLCRWLSSQKSVKSRELRCEIYASYDLFVVEGAWDTVR